MTPLAEVIYNLSPKDILQLYQESESLHQTGIATENTLIREISKKVFGEDNVMQLTLVSFELYRQLAAFTIKQLA